MVRADGLLDDGQRAPVERLRLAVAPLFPVETAQVRERCRDLESAGPQGFFIDTQRAPVQRLGLGIAGSGLV
jgi:hypothetical protein